MRESPHKGTAALTPVLISLILVASAAGIGAPHAAAETAPAIEGPEELRAAGERARAALGPLKRNLKSALQAALAESPTEAVDVCQISAPAITDSAGRPGIRLGRTSSKLRNPANAPQPWMEAQLAELEKQTPPPGTGRVVQLDGGRVGYVEPIYLQPLCGTCHGDAIDPALLAHIRERYPEDRAVGYAPGELRGLFWAIVENDASHAAGDPPQD